MQRIIIPAHYVHTRSTPLWTRETTPASIWRRHLDASTRQGVYPRLLVMQGAIRHLGYADETSPEPVETLTIEAGQPGVFPPEKQHCIKAFSENTVFNVDFCVDPKTLIEGQRETDNESKGYASAVGNGQRQERHEKIYLKPMALHTPQHTVEAVNSLLDDLPVNNEKGEWVLTVTNNDNGVSIDKTFSSLAALYGPLIAADTVKDPINIVRGYESDKEINVCGW